MGMYLIPGAVSVLEAAAWALPAGGSTMAVTGEGVLVEGPQTDAELASLYSGFAPSGETDDQVVAALPKALRTHAGHLRDYEQAIRSGTPVTAAQTQHVLADVITWIRLSEDRL